MIFPERVWAGPAPDHVTGLRAIGPISRATRPRRAAASGRRSPRGMTNTATAWPVSASSMPAAPASLHALGDQRRLDLDRQAVPETFTTSSSRPRIQHSLSASTVAESLGDVVAAARRSRRSPASRSRDSGSTLPDVGHPGPGPTGHQRAGDPGGDLPADLVDHGHVDAGQRAGRRAGLQRRHPGQGHEHRRARLDCHQVSMIGSSPRPKVRWNQIQARG